MESMQLHHHWAYRIAGGAPAGIMRLPGEEGCRTISTIISIMTIHGNRSTAPRGTEIFELPLSRMRLLKKDNLGIIRSFSWLRSASDGRATAEGIRFVIPCMSPMALTSPRRHVQRWRDLLSPNCRWRPSQVSLRSLQCDSLSELEVHGGGCATGDSLQGSREMPNNGGKMLFSKLAWNDSSPTHAFEALVVRKS